LRRAIAKRPWIFLGFQLEYAYKGAEECVDGLVCDYDIVRIPRIVSYVLEKYGCDFLAFDATPTKVLPGEYLIIYQA